MMFSALLTLHCVLQLPYRFPSRLCGPKASSITAPTKHSPMVEPTELSISDLNQTERQVAHHLKELGISDVNAISAFLGSIKQESNFNTTALNSSEGSYGIMQWRLGRRNRLEAHCKVLNDFNCQLSFVFTEPDWKDIEFEFKIQGKTIQEYNNLMKRYLRWGVEGNRVKYAQEYKNILVNPH